MNYEEIEIFATRVLINFCFFFTFRFIRRGELGGGGLLRRRGTMWVFYFVSPESEMVDEKQKNYKFVKLSTATRAVSFDKILIYLKRENV